MRNRSIAQIFALSVLVAVMVDGPGTSQKPHPRRQATPLITLSIPVMARKSTPTHSKKSAAKKRGKKKPPVPQPLLLPPQPMRPLHHGLLDGLPVVVDFGHGGNDTGMSWSERINPADPALTFYEAAYTYNRGLMLVRFLREEGAKVYLTVWSDTAAKAYAAGDSLNKPLPLPSDAVFVATNPKTGFHDGVTVSGWHYRTDLANHLYHKGKPMGYVAIHINSMPGYKGSSISVRDCNDPPLLAMLLKSKLVDPKDEVGKPLPSHALTRPNGTHLVYDSFRTLYLFSHSQIPDTIIWEMGVGEDPGDSRLIRDKQACGQYIDQMMVSALEDYAKLKTK